MKTLDYVCKNYWNYGNKNFVGINLLKNVDSAYLTNLDNCLLIVSADYSHFLPMQEAIKLENCAAHALMHKYFPSHLKCIDVIDDVKSFKLMYDYLPKDYNITFDDTNIKVERNANNIDTNIEYILNDSNEYNLDGTSIDNVIHTLLTYSNKINSI
jgi:hypothetical protein